MNYGHQWSGWPGAYCQKCGADDFMELAIGRSVFDPYTNKWATPAAEKEYAQQPCKWRDWDFHSDDWKYKVSEFKKGATKGAT